MNWEDVLKILDVPVVLVARVEVVDLENQFIHLGNNIIQGYPQRMRLQRRTEPVLIKGI